MRFRLDESLLVYAPQKLEYALSWYAVIPPDIQAEFITPLLVYSSRCRNLPLSNDMRRCGKMDSRQNVKLSRLASVCAVLMVTWRLTSSRTTKQRFDLRAISTLCRRTQAVLVLNWNVNRFDIALLVWPENIKSHWVTLGALTDLRKDSGDLSSLALHKTSRAQTSRIGTILLASELLTRRNWWKVARALGLWTSDSYRPPFGRRSIRGTSWHWNSSCSEAIVRGTLAPRGEAWSYSEYSSLMGSKDTCLLSIGKREWHQIHMSVNISVKVAAINLANGEVIYARQYAGYRTIDIKADHAIHLFRR